MHHGPKGGSTGVPAARTALLAPLVSLILWGAAWAGSPPSPPGQDTSWPIRVFAGIDSFQVRYDRFFRSHFDTVSVEGLPAWIDVDAASLAPGEQVLARPVTVTDNGEQVRKRLLELVSMNEEIGLTRFSVRPGFSPEHFVLGHRDGSLTLVPYDASEVKDPLTDLDAVRYLVEKEAFLTAGEDGGDIVVLSKGTASEVDMWYPRLAASVLHTHTIPGNINPTGYLEFFEGSDRDQILISFRFQDPIRRLLLSPRGSGTSGN